MKTPQWLVPALAILHPALAPAQYSIDWHTTDSGGGTSIGGNYTVIGTIGQTDAGGSMTGGNYVITRGFWSFVAVVGRSLRIVCNTDGTISLIWPSHLVTYTLRESPDLEVGNWTLSTHPVTDNGVTRSVTFMPAHGRRFFRLSE